MNFFNNNGCGNGFTGGTGCGCDACSLILWIMILQCLCGGNNNGCGMDCCTLILLLLLCGNCGCNK